jgi:hypothetical protein
MSEFIFPAVFALRLPRSTRRQANEMAKQEGLSLNQFITLAVAEKIVRMESREFENPVRSHTRHRPESDEEFLAS